MFSYNIYNRSSHSKQLMKEEPKQKQRDKQNITEKNQKIRQQEEQQQMFETNLFNDYNLIDFGNDENSGETLVNQKNYSEFLEDRVIELDKPELIKEGYLISYKLYKIKSKKRSQLQYDTYVSRRFNDFQYLHYNLIEKYGGYVLPRLPVKNFLATLNFETKEFQQQRVKQLQKYLEKLLSHQKIRFSSELRHFLFDEQFTFSWQKGQFLQQSGTLGNIKSLTSSFFNYGKKLLSKYMGNSQPVYEFSKNNQEQLQFKTFQNQIQELMKTTEQINKIVRNSIQEYMIIHDFIFSKKKQMFAMDRQGKDSQSYEDLIYEFEAIEEFIVDCHDAIQRTKELRIEINTLQAEQQDILKNQAQNPRNRQLDTLRNRLQKSKAKYEKWMGSLKKQMINYTSQGKTLMEKFVRKLIQEKRDIYSKQKVKV